MNVSISDASPANTSIMSFSLPILSVTLTPSTGSPVSLFSSTTGATFDLTRFQADSDLLASNVSVAAGAYTAVNVTVGAPSGVFFNGSTAAVGSCAAGQVCPVPLGTAGTLTFTFNSPLTLTANQAQWLDLDFNYNNAIVTTNGIGIDITQPNFLTALSTPPMGIPTGDFANIDDFTGQVTAISPTSSITIKSTLRGSLTAVINSSTVPLDPQSQCGGGASLSPPCIQSGSIVSLQGVLTNAGITTATEVDVIDSTATPADEVEGTVYSTNCNGASGLGLLLSDSSISTSASPLVTAGFGSKVCLTLAAGVTFAIDKGILSGQTFAGTFAGANDLFPGQAIRAKVTNAASGTNIINATASALILRFSRLTASVNNVSGTSFTITSFPAYFTSFVAGATPAVQTYTNVTLFEGIPNIGGLSSPGTVSITALFLNPGTSQQPFQAAKVRVP
jgi:hypothetical protein